MRYATVIGPDWLQPTGASRESLSRMSRGHGGYRIGEMRSGEDVEERPGCADDEADYPADESGKGHAPASQRPAAGGNALARYETHDPRGRPKQEPEAERPETDDRKEADD